jgi:NAD(P)-dependent dehydrogenase (short-subunit alcohol dehydrogenase family)
MVATAVREFGRLDIVVANAGLTLFGDFFEYTPASFAEVMRVNLQGTFFLAQAAAIQMRAQGDGGSIVFTSSVTGHQAHRQLTAYGMSKAAIEMLARSLVVELSPYRITVNAVAPGATLTERTAADPNYEQTWSALTPLGRPATPADIAQAVLFLAGPGARHITGQTLIVDGGWTVVSPGVSAPIRKQFLVRVFLFSRSFCSTRPGSNYPMIHVAFSGYTPPSIQRSIA